MNAVAAPVRVLVADDEAEERALLVEMLSSLGHEIVAEVGTGRDAVALAEAMCPDAVLLDVHMPDGSGIDAAKEITARVPCTAVLLFTGDHTLRLSDQDVEETAAISMLAKPTPKQTLDSALRLAVNKAQALDAARQEALRARQQLAERKLIEQAKGVLQRRTGQPEQVVYEMMRRQSQDRSIPMVQVAREILNSEPGLTDRARPDGRPSACTEPRAGDRPGTS